MHSAVANSGDSDASVQAATAAIRVGMTLRDAEQLLIEATLAAYPDKARAANVLGISKKTLYDRIRLYGAIRVAVAREAAKTA